MSFCKHYFIFICVFLFSACNPKQTQKVTIAVAANMQFAMVEIVEAFKAEYSIEVETSSSSSGILTTQIRQGAPFDIFISANMIYPNTLYGEGLALTPPKVYATGSLVLWSLKDSIDLSSGLNTLLSDQVSHFAIANPETAPYGIAALQCLKNTEMHDILESKIVIGESIGQVNQYIQSKSVEAGITSKSVLYSPNVINKGVHIELDNSLYNPIEQGIVQLKRGVEKNEANTKLFYDFMFSNQVQQILVKFGYNI